MYMLVLSLEHTVYKHNIYKENNVQFDESAFPHKKTTDIS